MDWDTYYIIHKHFGEVIQIHVVPDRDYPDYHSLQYILQDVLYLGDKSRELLMSGNDHRQRKGEIKEQEKQVPYI